MSLRHLAVLLGLTPDPNGPEGHHPRPTARQRLHTTMTGTGAVLAAFVAAAIPTALPF